MHFLPDLPIFALIMDDRLKQSNNMSKAGLQKQNKGFTKIVGYTLKES
jgi:hypothetical protein